MLELWYFTWVLIVSTNMFDLVNLILKCVLLFESFNLANDFWTVNTRSWFFSRSILVTRLLRGYQNFWPCDLDLGVWHIFEHFIFANNISNMGAIGLIFHISIRCDKTFPWVPVTLTLEFKLFSEKSNLEYKFWTVSARALIFNISKPCDKVFPGKAVFTLWPCLFEN